MKIEILLKKEKRILKPAVSLLTAANNRTNIFDGYYQP